MKGEHTGVRWVVTLCVLLASCGDGEGGQANGASAAESTGGSGTSASTSGGATTAGVTTGGSGDSNTAGCDAGVPADPVPPQACDNPRPGTQVSSDTPSGWILCDGGTRHREEAVPCESPTECETDSDCGGGQICECVGASSSCMTAYCTTDADCLEGYHCWRWNDRVACDGPYDRCRVEPCLSDGTICEVCEYQPSMCALDCVDYGPCTG